MLILQNLLFLNNPILQITEHDSSYSRPIEFFFIKWVFLRLIVLMLVSQRDLATKAIYLKFFSFYPFSEEKVGVTVAIEIQEQ